MVYRILWTNRTPYSNKFFLQLFFTKIWNGLPLDIKQSMSVDCFKSFLKTFLFRLASEQSRDFNEERSVIFFLRLCFYIIPTCVHIVFNTVKLFRILCNVSAI